MESIPTQTPSRNGSTLDAALAYLGAGLSIISIGRDGTKQPDRKWKSYQTERVSEAVARKWFSGSTPPGIAVLGGAVSGGLECIDFDLEAEKTFPVWCELVSNAMPGLLERLSIVRTPRPGYHVRYRCTEIEIPGNHPLARLKEKVDVDGKKVDGLIETRGEGGYAIVPGTPPECHPHKRTWEHFSGPKLSQVQTITGTERDLLIRCAQSFDQKVDDDVEERKARAQHNGQLRAGDDFNARGPDWPDLLQPHGWDLMLERGGVRYWRRPGKPERGHSATTDYLPGKFCVFSSSASPFPGPNGKSSCSSHDKFAVYAILNHGGDFKAAAKALAAQGYGHQQKVPAGSRPAGAGGSPDRDVDGVGIIRQYLQSKLEPTFRRGASIYSAKMGREVRKPEVCAAPGSDLIEKLLQAPDFPRTDQGPKRGAVPVFYKNWAPVAWQDLLDSLPDEQDAPEIAESAAEQFRSVVAEALLTLEAFVYTHKGDGDDRNEVQRRTLLAWCKTWAKPGRWESIRTLSLWTKLDEGRLCVAMHHRLFSQIRRGHLAPWSHRRFTQLCEVYGVGIQGKIGNSRAVELHPDFLADLLAGPEDGREDGKADGHDYRRYRDPVPSSSPSASPSSEGV